MWCASIRGTASSMDLLLAAIATLCCVLVPSLLLIIYRCKSKRSYTPKIYLLFIDGPDPDNPACALALWNHLVQNQPSPHLHIVLTGRPVNLRTKKEFKSNFPIKEQIARQPWESINHVHSHKLLMDSAARISNCLISCGLHSGLFTIYDGGIAPSAPISDVAHDWDFLYDRKDLITGDSLDEGKIITGSDYQILVQKYNLLTEDAREEIFVSLLRDYEMIALSSLRVMLKQAKHREISVFLGGPATAIVNLFKGDQNKSLCEKVAELYAMFGALSPSNSTLLGNQFNAACDIEAASELFLEKIFPNAPMYVIPTETAKLPELIVSGEELQNRGCNSYTVSLMRLWESTHNGCPQPIFDVLPVMAAVDEFKEGFTWRKMKVVVQDWSKEGKIRQRFMFTETDQSSLYVSDGAFSFSKELFMQFLDLSFRRQ